MVEILVVIGILGILVTVLVIAMGGLGDSSKGRQTHTTLQNTRNLITEFEQSVRLSDKQPEAMYYRGGKLTYNPTNKNFDVWKYYEFPIGTPNPQAANHYYALYGDNTTKIGPVATGRDERYSSDAILNTQLVLDVLETAPGNKAMLAGLPANARMEEAPLGTKLYLQENEIAGSVKRNRPRLLLDGWHNPIIFVPASGIVVSVTKPDGTVGDRLIRSPDKRPFWASAGPDGSFTDPDPDPNKRKPAGQDNLYSFEN